MTLTLMPEEPSIVANMENSGIGPVTSAEVSKAMRQHAPKLKPLVWKVRSKLSVVAGSRDDDFYYDIFLHMGIAAWSRDRCLGVYKSLEEAKAAAQADYERRVRGLFE